MSEMAILLQGVSKSFKKTGPNAIENMTISLPAKKLIGLVGPDGSGKSTLIRLMSGLLIPTEGRVFVFGYDTILHAEKIHQIVGVMPQKFGLYEDLTVRQNLELYADLKGVFGQEREVVFKRLLAFTSLDPFQGRLAGALSGGMKQKLGLAASLLAKPDLLLLDEPTVGVDPISRRELFVMIRALVDEGVTVVWSTAYLDEAEKCDHVLLLNEGKVLFKGPPRDLTDRCLGRVYKISGIEPSCKRQELSRILELPSIVDGVIQGKDIRVVFDRGVEKKISLEKEEVMEEVAPRFEDAFIDLLGKSIHFKENLIPLKEEKGSSVAVEADDLTKKFGDFNAVNQVSFQIKRGGIFGLLGPNGAGKTTTFKMLCGLLTPTSGKALVNGEDLAKAPSLTRSRIGYMAQKFSLYGLLSTLQNLDFFSGVYPILQEQRGEIVERVVEMFGLGPYLNETAETLPLGIKQRLSLASAIMHHPDVLFLDEPTSGVDPVTRREFWNYINNLVESGVTVVVTTHFMDEAEYCDRIGLVYKSRLIKVGTPDALKEAVATKERPNPTLEDAFIDLIEAYQE